MLNAFSLVNGIYTKNYQAHPVLTLAFTNGNLAALSDILAQSISIAANRKYHKGESEGAKERLHSNEHFDSSRLLRFSLYGFTIAPIVHSWFSLLDRNFPLSTTTTTTTTKTTTFSLTPASISPSPPSVSSNTFIKKNNLVLMNTLKRVAVDQVFFAPFGLFFFFGFMGILEGHDYDRIKLKFNEVYIYIYIDDK